MAPTRVLLSQERSSKRSRVSIKPLTKLAIESDNEAHSHKALEKDDTELRLEKLLFGDEIGFLDSLQTDPVSRKQSLVRVHSQDSNEGAEEDGLDEIADEDLFFLDSGSGALPLSLTQEPASKVASSETTKLAWYDSDDDRIQVSLASNTRLRKLRDTESDDIVTGRDYIFRLRRQYERLHPTPDWAKYASRKKQRKEERLNGEDSDVSMASGVSSDDEPLMAPVQPLAELLRSAGALTRTDETQGGGRKRRKLRAEVIDIQRTSDVTGQGPSAIDTLQFHPKYPLLLSAGPSSTITLYHISPQPPNPNPLLTSMHVKGTPIHTAAFCAQPPSRSQSVSSTGEQADTTQIFFASRRRYFHNWSLSSGIITKISRPMYGTSRTEQRTTESFKLSPSGQYMALVGSPRKGGGSVNVLDAQSMQWVCSCRIDSQGGIADFSWWRNGEGFAVVGKNGEVSEYDINLKRVVARWLDEGAVGTSVISLGGDLGTNHLGGARWVAVGSSSGIVNIYDRLDWVTMKADGENGQAPRRPKPARVLDQLTTPISHLTFSRDGQMLVMASRWKKNAMRLVHLPTCTVYKNWPTDKTPLGRVSSVALSLDGTLLAVGNEQGKIRLWEVRD